MIEFFQTYKPVIDIFIGIASGIAISTFAFLLSYRFNWRNRLTKEFTVKIRDSHRDTKDKKIKKMHFNYEINCTNSDQFSINYSYIKIPSTIQGSVPPNPTLGEMIYGAKGRHYIQSGASEFRHFKADSFVIDEPKILQAIGQNKIKCIQLIVNTSRYGDVKSNKIKIKNDWIMKLGIK